MTGKTISPLSQSRPKGPWLLQTKMTVLSFPKEQRDWLSLSLSLSLSLLPPPPPLIIFFLFFLLLLKTSQALNPEMWFKYYSVIIEIQTKAFEHCFPVVQLSGPVCVVALTLKSVYLKSLSIIKQYNVVLTFDSVE